MVSDCFKNESNAVFGVLLQKTFTLKGYPYADAPTGLSLHNVSKNRALPYPLFFCHFVAWNAKIKTKKPKTDTQPIHFRQNYTILRYIFLVKKTRRTTRTRRFALKIVLLTNAIRPSLLHQPFPKNVCLFR